MRVCIDCPHCNHGDGALHDGCSDLFGSNAYPEGGIHGRADGIFISVEAQKSTGGLHAHAQVHVQCIHQHTPLAEILETLMHKDTNLVRDYLSYKAHVCRQEYDDLPGWRSRQQQTEEDWPELKKKRKAPVVLQELAQNSGPTSMARCIPETVRSTDTGDEAEPRAHAQCQRRTCAAHALPAKR